MTSPISNRRVSVPTTTQVSTPAATTKTASQAATVSASDVSTFEAAKSGAKLNIPDSIKAGVGALKDTGAQSLIDYLSDYPSEDGAAQAAKDYEAIKGKLSPDQQAAVENAMAMQTMKINTQALMRSIAEAVADSLKHEISKD